MLASGKLTLPDRFARREADEKQVHWPKDHPEPRRPKRESRASDRLRGAGCGGCQIPYGWHGEFTDCCGSWEREGGCMMNIVPATTGCASSYENRRHVAYLYQLKQKVDDGGMRYIALYLLTLSIQQTSWPGGNDKSFPQSKESFFPQFRTFQTKKEKLRSFIPVLSWSNWMYEQHGARTH